jgi:hypothetical protein
MPASIIKETDGCLLMSLVASIVLTILLNLILNWF